MWFLCVVNSGPGRNAQSKKQVLTCAVLKNEKAKRGNSSGNLPQEEDKVGAAAEDRQDFGW